MKPPRFLASPQRLFVVLPALFVLASLLAGCGHATRPDSSLSAHQRDVLAAYEQVRAGLASDDFKAAKRGAVALLAELKKSNANPSSAQLITRAQALVDAKALDNLRQGFKPVSAALVPVAEGVQGYYIMSSPPGMEADWIQRTPDVDNPYFGKVMHSMGSQKS